MSKHHMLGIQTLGTKPGCVILEFALCYFLDESDDRKHFRLVKPTMRHARISIKSQMKAGATIDYDTLKWWVDTNPLRLQNIMNDEYAETPYFTAKWFEESAVWENANIWARDWDFEYPLMDDFFTRFGTPGKHVWKFSHKRSHQVLLNLAGVKHTPATNTHGAVADVEARIESAIEALRVLLPHKFT